MNRLIGMCAIVMVCSVLMGCIEEESRTDLNGSTFTGVIPCADCEGIAYRLSLKKDQRFETSSVYIGKSNQAFTERGNWTVKGDSLLVLNPSEESPRQFKIKNNQLIMLDREGNEVSGSLAKMYVLGEADSLGTDRRWEERRKQGIDFRAVGNEPSWSLDIDFDKMMTFKTLNGDSILTPIPQMQQDTTTKARVWNARVESGSLQVEMYPTGCVDDMSGEVFGYRVSVNYGDQSYSGCGNFINNTYKLNDFWSLYKLNRSEIIDDETSQGGRELPTLQFNLAENKVYGNTGCNQLNGTIALQDSSLSFSKMVTTKRACLGDLESRFLDALQKVEGYSIANAQLLLINQKDTLMVFRRAE